MTSPRAEISADAYGPRVRQHLWAWFVLLAIAIFNGTLREYGYGHLLSPLAAHQVSTVIAMLLTGGFVWVLARYWPLPDKKAAHKVGGVWLLATVCFAFVVGHFVMGKSWYSLMAEYDLSTGRLWSVFLLWIALMPSIFLRYAR